MEPFGVLNLIRSLLETNQTAEETPPPSNKQTDFTPPPTEESSNTPTQNSYLAFAQAHEERARKLRK